MSNKENKQSERCRLRWISRITNVERETKKVSERQVVFQVSSKKIICQILVPYITEIFRRFYSSLCGQQQSTKMTRQCWHCSPIELGISATRTNSSSWWVTTTSLSSARDFGSFGRCSHLIRNSSCKKSTKDWSELREAARAPICKSTRRRSLSQQGRKLLGVMVLFLDFKY